MPLAMTPPERWLIERVTVVDDKELREPVLHFGHPWEGSKVRAEVEAHRLQRETGVRHEAARVIE
jgi:hypothetical protein